MTLPALRLQLERVVAPSRVEADRLATGLAALDAALRGGLPRGQVTELAGPMGAGATTLLHHLVARAREAGWWVACVDATRTLAPRDWAPLAAGEGFTVVRPRAAARGAWCADVLLRSGAWPLVVLDGAPPLPRPVAVRLATLAREKDVAFVVVSHDPAAAPLGAAIRLGVTRRARRWRGGPARRPPIEVTVEKGGERVRLELDDIVPLPPRLAVHDEAPDRRGAGWQDGSATRPATRGPS